MSKNNSHKGISLFIKLGIAIAAFAFIYQKIFLRNDIREIENVLGQTFSSSNYYVLSIVFLLMIVNWGLEAFKWRLLVQRIQPISYFQALQDVFCGITVSIFTPNRTGEFGGRIFTLEKSNRVKGILLSLTGSLSQFLVTMIAGIIALLFFIPQYTSFTNQNTWLCYSFFFLMAVLIIALLLLYFNLRLFIDLLDKKNYASFLKKYIPVISDLRLSEFIQLFCLSVLRYIVFSIQFFLLLKIFNVTVSFVDGFVMIALTFFAISIIPTVAFTEISVRGSAALTFIGMLSDNAPGIICSSFLLWIINIVFPSVVGIPFVFKLNFFDKEVSAK